MDGDLLAVRNIDYNPFGEAVTIWSETNQLSTRSYDRLGRVVAVTESVRREGSTKIDTYDAYAYDALGQQIRHVQYAGGRRVGEIRNDPQDEAHPSLVLDQQGQTPRDNNTLSSTFKPVVTADFDQNYEPFNLGTPGNAATYYTVRAGDTLAGVALQVWGNASLWYLIAEANGLSGTEALQPGQLLRLPNGITNIHNNSQTLRPYNPAEVIGDGDPTVSRPPPPPDLRCGAFSTIIGVVVNAVVSFYTLNPALGAVAGDAARQYSSAALNGQLDYKHFVRESAKMMLGEMIFGPLGSLGQFLSDPKHPPGFNEHSYDYQSTLIAGAAGLASQGMSAVAANWSGWGTYARAAAQAAASNATSQYLAVAMGRADDFSWRAVAASALGAAAGHGVSGYLEGTDWGSAYENLGANAGGDWVGGVVEQRLLPHEQRDYPGVFAGTVGGIIGDGILAGPKATRREQQRADNRRLPFTNDQTLALRGGGTAPDPQATHDLANTLLGMMAYQSQQEVSLEGTTQYADAGAVQERDRLMIGGPLLDAGLLSAQASRQRNVRDLQALLDAARSSTPDVGLRLSTQAALAQQEFRRMEIEQMNAAAAGSAGVITIELPHQAFEVARGIGDVAEMGVLGIADMTVAPLADVAQAALKYTHGSLTGDVRALVPLSSFGSSVVVQGASTAQGLQVAAVNTAMVSPVGLLYGAYHSGHDLATNAMAGNVRGTTAAGAGLGLTFAGARAMGPVALNADLLPRMSGSGSGPVSASSQRGAIWVGNTGSANVSAADGAYIPRGPDGVPIPLPQRAVPGVGDVPLPLPEAGGAPHTVLGGRLASDGESVYRQTATFPGGTWPPLDGGQVPWGRVDWTDHSYLPGPPHPNPHIHEFYYDPVQKQWQIGSAKPFWGH